MGTLQAANVCWWPLVCSVRDHEKDVDRETCEVRGKLLQGARRAPETSSIHAAKRNGCARWSINLIARLAVPNVSCKRNCSAWRDNAEKSITCLEFSQLST